MDQIKIGKFIAAMRKSEGCTQRQLADMLGISDKTVSKWETGNGLPDVSLMMPLCDLLHISVNELLSGEPLSDSEYKKRAEVNMMNLIEERQESKKKILLSVIVCLLTFLPGVTLIVLSGALELKVWLRILLVAIGIIAMVGGMGVAAALDITAGTYECTKCKTRFVPSASAYIAGPHTFTKRKLMCPKCNEISYCKKRLTH